MDHYFKHNTFYDNLQTGDAWERYVCDWLTSRGIRAWQPKQQLAPYWAPKISDAIARGKLALAEHYLKNAEKEATATGAYSRLQIDLLCRIEGRLYRCEVKSFDGWLFEREEILIQSVARLEKKQFAIDATFVVNRDTGVIYWINCLPLQAHSVSDRGSDLSYSVRVCDLRTADEFLTYGWQRRQSPKIRLFWQWCPWELIHPPEAA